MALINKFVISVHIIMATYEFFYLCQFQITCQFLFCQMLKGLWLRSLQYHLTWGTIRVEWNGGPKRMWLKYGTFANFSEMHGHMKIWRRPCPSLERDQCKWGTYRLSSIGFTAIPPLGEIFENFECQDEKTNLKIYSWWRNKTPWIRDVNWGNTKC